MNASPKSSANDLFDLIGPDTKKERAKIPCTGIKSCMPSRCNRRIVPREGLSVVKRWAPTTQTIGSNFPSVVVTIGAPPPLKEAHQAVAMALGVILSMTRSPDWPFGHPDRLLLAFHLGLLLAKGHWNFNCFRGRPLTNSDFALEHEPLFHH